MKNFEIEWKTKPLWKIKLTNEQYIELKKILKEAYFENKQLFKYDKEAALYFANWWSREYVGGARDRTPSIEKIAYDLGIDSIQSKELFFWAKRGLKKLKISPIFRNGRTHYFRTLLLQGGLPLKSLKEGQNRANYGAFFEGLIKYTNEFNFDYNDLGFIDYLPCKNRLSPSFQNVDFYELNLQIIDDFREKNEDSEYWELISSIFERDDDHASVNKIKKLLKEKNIKNTRSKKLFTLNWNVRKNENEVLLFFSLTLPQIIKQNDLSEIIRSQYEFTVFLENKEVAKYNRTLPDKNGDIFFVKSKGKNEISDNFLNNRDISLRLSNNGIFQELIFAKPEFSEPILLSGFDNIWSLNKQQQDDILNAVLLLNDSEWVIDSKEILSVRYCDLEAFWIESKDSIKLKNKITNDLIEFDNSPKLYSFDLLHQPEIKSKNRKLINENVRFQIKYNIDDKIIDKGFKIFFRPKNEKWNLYSNRNTLPTGILYFKFEYPDNKFEYAKFFNIGNLRVENTEQLQDSGIISVDNWNGEIHPKNEQMGIAKFDILAENCWKFFRDTNQRFYTNAIEFRLIDTQGVIADILISPPFRGVTVTDIKGNISENHSTIALYSLWQYKCLVFGKESIKVTIFHNKNINNQKTFNYNLNRKNEIPLSDIEESIRNLFILFGTDHTDADSFVTISLANYSIFVRSFNINIDRNEWRLNRIIKLDPIKSELKLLALKVDCEYADEIEIIELIQHEYNFVLPEMNDKISGVVVYSDNNNSLDNLRPTFIPVIQNQTPSKERLNNIRNEILIARYIDEIWDKIIMYFRLLTAYNLPFKTIDYFRIIAESSLSMAKFALVLLDHREDIKSEERNKGLLLFENEFALAWHWIDIQTWKLALEWFVGKHDEYAEYYIKDILTNSLLANPHIIKHLYIYISTNIVNEDNKIDEQNIIQSYMRFVNIDSDDWLIMNENNRVIFPELKDSWQNLFSRNYGFAFKTFLWGPAKAALSIMGQDKDEEGNFLLWKSENEIQRRIIYYYWKLNPEAYTNLFIEMVKKINFKLNNKI